MMPEEDSRADAEIVAETLVTRDSFALLIKRYESKLDRYARRLGVVRKEDREDILQDVFIKVYRNLHAYDQSLSFSSWIYRITHNETMSWFRRRSARPEHLMVDDGDAVLSMISDGKEIEREHMVKEDSEEVRGLLDTLPSKYRDVLLLRFFEEKRYEEIGDILQIPIGTVATLVYRAKDRLKQAVEQKRQSHTTS